MDTKVYLFNPFNLSKVTEEAICEQIDVIASKFKPDADAPFDIAHNIEIGANLMGLEGEIIARYTRLYNSKKLDNDTCEMLLAHKLRKEWDVERDGKAPAMSYFEAKAVERSQVPREEEFRLYENLTRFKYAYQSTEAKTNAWKKKLDATRFEIGGN